MSVKKQRRVGKMWASHPQRLALRGKRCCGALDLTSVLACVQASQNASTHFAGLLC